MSMATMVMISSRQKRDERGRYMDGNQMTGDRMENGGRGRSEYDNRYWQEPHIPPYLADDPMEMRRMEGSGYKMRDKNVVNIRDYQDKRKIGFDPRTVQEEWGNEGENPYGEEPEVYRRQREERRDSANRNQMMHKQKEGMGHHGQDYQKRQMEQRMRSMREDRGSMQELDKETAMEWVECMEDASGVKGGAYSWHQAQQYGRNMGITGEQRLIEFYAVMNAMHSDYWTVAKKFGVDKPEFYAHLAKCFIEDPDAVDDKVYKYYECIAAK